MGRTIAGINGESDWQRQLPGFEVVSRRLQDCSWVLLERNDTPGLSGFPERMRTEVAQCLISRMAR